MSLLADQTALDLLDAHLEALWDGADLSLPQALVCLAAEGEGELILWALGQLRRIPCEPKGAFARQVGSLLAEFRSRRCPWNAAALRLLDDTYTFATTGPRRYEAWAHDVHAVLHRSVPDPRGWVRLDWDRTNAARHTAPAYPLDPPDAPEFPDRLYPPGGEGGDHRARHHGRGMAVGARPHPLPPGPGRRAGGCPNPARPLRAHRALLDFLRGAPGFSLGVKRILWLRRGASR
ncbi:hypothetical protein HEP84_00345 [Streptomyces sp. RLB1-33]